ncbi:hypothetical protein EDB81DRAFT_910575 [Dactylonectria macrodidyma]|uniref:Uncharacterized protein n=1 Tax=Dactylonectria macrodidyma TaxID=307937 RepID=A0A9P9DV92_9HYPO|nr:hypothetical protein EDB81DRAFT_910575 [Dactylonectria macrodidyma]
MSGTGQFDLVSSQYGPGTLGCWVLSVASVFISWTLHRDYRNRDSLNVDLILALAFPFIAACDVMYQVVHYPRDFESADDPELAHIQHLLSMQAPFSVIALFCDIAPWMVMNNQRGRISRHRTPNKRRVQKRSTAVYMTWIICIVAWVVRYFRGPNEEDDHERLRPFGGATYRSWIMNMWILVESDHDRYSATYRCFWGIGSSLYLLPWLFFIGQAISLACSLFASMQAALAYRLNWREGEFASRPVSVLNAVLVAILNERIIRVNIYNSMVVPHLFAIAGQFIGGDLGQYLPQLHNPFHLSGNSISELDQAFALFSGTAVFLFWCWGTYKSRIATMSLPHSRGA